MLSENLTKALSNQINAEYYSAYLYLIMSAAAEGLGLKGTANWLFVQSQEEMSHGTHIYDYIIARGATPAFKEIKKPPTDYTDIREIFELVHAHELVITKSINSIATEAMKELDHACYQFMLWYVNEQVEEESKSMEILDKLRMIGDEKGMMLALDNDLSTRVFENPFAESA